jgi:hypothetical protein
MASDPTLTPPPPPVERLNRSVLLVAAAIVLVTLLVVAFVVSPPPRPPAGVGAPAPVAGAPGFLAHPPGTLPAAPRPALTDQDYLRALQEQAALMPPAVQGPPAAIAGEGPAAMAMAMPGAGAGVGGAGAAGAAMGGGSPAVAAGAVPAPRDVRREAFLRALRAPLVETMPPSLPVAAGLPLPLPWTASAMAGAPSASAGAVPAAAAPSPAAVGAPAVPGRPGGASLPGAADVAVRQAARADTLAAGTLIPALLETAVDSDLPGPLLAQVSRDVYDFRQEVVLVPRGARLLGRYDNQVGAGQRRLLVAWTRLELPDGRVYELPGLTATDPSGEAGLSAKVQNHLLRVFGDALLLSLLSAGADLSQPQDRDLSLAPSAGSVASAAVGQELASVGVQLLRRDLSIQPTLRLAAGTPLVVFVAGDLPLGHPGVVRP